MKRKIILVIIVSGSLQAALIPSDCLVSVESHWENVESNSHEKELGGKWMLIGSITFRKKSKEPTKLETMKLAWHGKHIDYLYGSLYKKLPNKKFMALEQNLICDGNWNIMRQELVLNFNDNKQTLGPINIFYLVLTVPDELEDVLKTGHFSVVQTALPTPFQSKTQLNIDLAQLSSAKDRKLSTHAS